MSSFDIRQNSLPPFDPKEAMTSVNSVRNNGVQAEK